QEFDEDAARIQVAQARRLDDAAQDLLGSSAAWRRRATVRLATVRAVTAVGSRNDEQSVHQIVERSDATTRIEQSLAEYGTEVSRAAGNQYVGQRPASASL